MTELPPDRVIRGRPLSEQVFERLSAGASFPLWRNIPAGVDRQSAVLVPLFPLEGSLFTLFLRRSPGLSRHGGEICFPGGMKEATDESPLTTALREAEEETGIAPERITPLAQLQPEYTVVTGVEIFPVLGAVRGVDPRTGLALPSGEIARAYAVDILGFSRTPRRKTFSLPETARVSYPEYDLPDGTVIWGVTARILEKVREML